MKTLAAWVCKLPVAKIAVIAAFATIGATLPRDLSLRDRLGAFFTGFLAALVFGEPVRTLLGLPETWAFGMAGILAMTGRNIAVFALRASRDPARLARDIMDIWRGPRGR